MKNDKVMPRVLIAGANSGCGKTSITCGILKALTDRGLKIQSYKCGPDYIDPMLHTHITGQTCRNLDPFFSVEGDLRCLMAKDSRHADFSVAEGVMGYYDGIGVSCEKSTHTVSVATDTPVILVVNVKGMSHTMIPIIKGLVGYRDNPVKGVILNRCSKGLFEMMKPELEKETGIRAVGYFPQKEGIHIGSRHLGLMTASEISNLDEVISLLGEMAEECIDIEALLALGREASPLPEVNPPALPARKRARIAVAWDKAFCFYYQENLEILEQLGAELIYFSPVRDTELPEAACGIYLGGGYPETYRRELSENVSMRAAIREAAREGKPIFAECGGFMYTCRNLIETDGSSMPMLGLVPTDVEMTRRLSMQFGYVEVEGNRDTAFFKKGEVIRAHEFHYSKAGQRGDAASVRKSTGRSWQGIYVLDRVLSGYPHFYFHNCRSVAERFVEMAEEFCR
ncbi:MAG: cobyrinate a,c-diamide synthase [Eubacterium sp.]|nr:cobyrinate a,c-diamide synthase [Eubacterium sp.]